MWNATVLIHCAGHYVAGRKFGIGLEVVSVGIGPKVFSFSDRQETVWKICLLPVGGYVRAQLEEPDAGGNENAIRKYAFMLAGPLANFAFSLIVFFSFFVIIGAPNVSGNQVVLVPQPIIDGLFVTMRIFVWTWTINESGDWTSLAMYYDSPATRMALLIAIMSSKLAALNLLPIPKLDGWRILSQILNSAFGSEKKQQYLKVIFRIEIVAILIVLGAATWNDLVHLRVIEYIKELLTYNNFNPSPLKLAVSNG